MSDETGHADIHSPKWRYREEAVHSREAMVTYRFAKALDAVNIPFVLEKTVKFMHGGIKRSCRFDIAVYHPISKELAVIVEIKKFKQTTDKSEQRRRLWKKTRQARKYQLLNLPVCIITCERTYHEALSFIKQQVGGN